VGCLHTICLSVVPTNKNYTDLNLRNVEGTFLYSPHEHRTPDLSHSMSDWRCALLRCLAGNTHKSPLLPSIRTRPESHRSEFTVSWKNIVPVILRACWAHIARRFSHHVMENEWSMAFPHSSSHYSGCSHNHCDETVRRRYKTLDMDRPFRHKLTAGTICSNSLFLLYLEAAAGKPQSLCTTLV
jgi:ABC-type nickel/cobalt efflux system permease component RcnA